MVLLLTKQGLQGGGGGDQVSTFRSLQGHAIDIGLVARLIQSTLSQLQIQFKERNVSFQRMDIYLYEERNLKCLGRTPFERSNLAPVKI